MHRWLFCSGIAVPLLPVWSAAASTPLTPAGELRSFQFADPNLTAQLVASEPDVISPVSIAWDAAGRLFVAEMRDYPTATNGGTIRVLRDDNGDGRYEKAVVFADGLPFPNSVLPWNDGLLVTAAPNLIFLRDNDGDGRADERRVLFTGFGTSNQQLRANGLSWGIDGWVYGANGRSDGSVRRTGETNAHSLRGRDFRFRPDTGEFETLPGRSQFGLALDDWGNRFLSWNTIPIRHEVFPERYLTRNANLPAVDIVADLLPANDAGEVFPLTPTPLVFNNESTSHFNALGGLTIYRGGALGRGYQGNVFLGETLRNLVHRRVLTPHGATFTAIRPEANTEFLRSNDPWFHAVNFATGPDDCLYVVDFYRQFVEHPEYVPSEMRTRVDWRIGSERGRIWRVVRKGTRRSPASTRSDLSKASVQSLARHLDGPNAWRRITAHRLLFQRNDRAAVPALRKLIAGAKLPESRALALHALSRLNTLNEETLLKALQDSHARVREQAVILSEPWLGTPENSDVRRRVIVLTSDTDARVRLRAALALGTVRDDSLRETTIEQILSRETDRWVRVAALSSSPSISRDRMTELLPRAAKPLRPPPVPVAPDPDRHRVVEQFSPALKMTGDRVRGAATFGRLCLACHYLQGHGQRVGSDLSGIAARPPEALLIDILDPSRQVAPDFATHEVTLIGGETISGLFSSETATRITIRRAGAPDENIPRAQVQSLRATGKSLMPDGLEAGLSLQDMADLIAFLQRPDGSMLPR